MSIILLEKGFKNTFFVSGDFKGYWDFVNYVNHDKVNFMSPYKSNSS